MKKQPLISIVTPTFNMGQFLGECIESVLAQNYRHVEHIIQDGKSTDNTKKILKQYLGQKYANTIRIFEEPDTGQNDGLNKALQKVRGDIILVLNADDVLMPYACSWAVEQFKLFPSMAVVYGDQYIIDEHEHVLKHTIGKPYNFEQLFCLELVPPAQASFINRSLFEKVGLRADSTIDTCPDFEMWVRIGLQYPMRYIPGTITKYRAYPHDDSRGPRSAKRFFNAKKAIIDRTLQQKKYAYLRKLRQRAYSGIALWASGQAREPEAIVLGIRFLVQALWWYPSINRIREIANTVLDPRSPYALRNIPYKTILTAAILEGKKHIQRLVPKQIKQYLRNLSANKRAVDFAHHVIASNAYKKLTIDPCGGRIENGIQYFFDGSKTTYPHVADEFMHKIFELTKGAPEPEELVLFLNLLKHLPERAVLMELGAGQGYYSIVAGTKLRKARLFLVEASKLFIPILKKNMRLNKLTSRSTILHNAVDKIDNQTVFLEESGYGSTVHDHGDYAVTTISIDNLIKQRDLKHVDLIHMDVQGAEYVTLQGMKHALSKHIISFLFIATHKDQMHILCSRYLQTFSYSIVYETIPSKSTSFDGILIATAPTKKVTLSF